MTPTALGLEKSHVYSHENRETRLSVVYSLTPETP